MNTREKLAVYLVAQFVAVAVLAVVVGAMLGRFPFGGPFTRPVATTLPTRVAMRTLEAVGVVLLLGYAGAVVTVLAAGRSLVAGARYWSAVGVTALSLPVLALALVVGWFYAGARVGRLLAVAALVGGISMLAVAVVSTLGLLHREGTEGDDGRDAAVLALTAVVCVGVLLGIAGVAGGADALVDERYDGGSPQAAFETTYEPINDTHGVLTIRHAGGDAVPRDRLFVRGSGIAAVEGVDQRSAGEWAGGALAGEGSGERRVVVGNATTVGVRADCEVDVVYQRGGASPAATTLDTYECPAHDD